MKTKHLFLFFLLLPICVDKGLASSPIEIEANEVIYNHKKGSSIYKGDVKITNGDLILYGEVVESFLSDGKLTKIISTKPPSQFVQRSENGNINGRANQIEYLVVKNKIFFRGNVHIKDKDKTFTGGYIVYNLKTKTFTSQKKGERIKLILNPKKSKDK